MILQVGGSYKVKAEFTSRMWRFVEGEILTYAGGGYSRYDDCYFYEFDDERGNRKAVALDHEASEEELRSLFDESI